MTNDNPFFETINCLPAIVGCKNEDDCSTGQVCCLGIYINENHHKSEQSCCDLRTSTACQKVIEDPEDID